MRTLLTSLAVVGLTMGGLATGAPAFAQSSSSSSSSTAPSSSTTGQTQTPGTMQKSVKNDLEQAGFTDVQVMPSSFLVRAKDKHGHPIMMVINPDSVTEIANVGHAPASGSNTTHK